jgi:hypothetical protein
VNLKLKVPPEGKLPESNKLLPLLVTVCEVPSWLTHVTVVPSLAVKFAVEK